MVIMILEKVSVSTRGELSRWLMEVDTGTYIGHISAMVRDRLWDKCISIKGNGSVFQAWSTNNEQHFNMRLSGSKKRQIVNWEGLLLVQEIRHNLTEVEKRRVDRD
jgi:CRISPR-associated protein Cas2